MRNGIHDASWKESAKMGKLSSPESTSYEAMNGNVELGPGNSLVSPQQSRERSRPEGSIASHRSTGKSSDSGGEGVSADSNFKVFVKLKPPPKGVKLLPSQLKLYQIVNPAIVVDLSDAHQDMSKNVDVVGKRFQFHGAFGASVTQRDIFERVVMPQVARLLAGENATLMSYGSANSGKSHTLEGSPQDPGLIFRALEMLFSQEELALSPNYKPSDYNKVEALNSEKRTSAAEMKKQILSSQNVQPVKSYSKLLRTIEESWVFPAGIRIGPQHEIWLSYLEIREEKYYDLLALDSQTSHSPLLFHTSPQGQTFVKGLTQLHVASVTEARNVLAIGRHNLKRLNSARNMSSSSSHCILNITLLKYDEINQPKRVQMSRFSFCDLAAHQESPRLDASLLGLVRSLRGLYESHVSPSPKKTEAFSPSKLTRLFKSSLTGNSSVSLITHVNPDPGIYRDTHASLHLTAIHTEILTKIRIPRPPQVSQVLRRIPPEGAEDLEYEEMSTDRAVDLITSLKHEQSAYRSINLTTRIKTNQTIITRFTSTMEKIDRCIQKKLEVLSRPADPHVLQMHQFAVDQMKSIFEYLQEDKTSAELELTEDEVEYEALASLPPDLKTKIPEEVDPGILLLKTSRRRKEEERRTEDLKRLLREARQQLELALRNNWEAERKLGAVERRYVALKVKNDMSAMLSRHKRMFSEEQKENHLRLKRLEEEVNQEQEKFRVYGIKRGISFDDWVEMEKLGEVDADFSDDEGRTGGLNGGVESPKTEKSGSEKVEKTRGRGGVDKIRVKSIAPSSGVNDSMHLDIMRELTAELEASKQLDQDAKQVETEVLPEETEKASDASPEVPASPGEVSGGPEVMKTSELNSEVPPAREVISPEPVDAPGPQEFISFEDAPLFEEEVEAEEVEAEASSHFRVPTTQISVPAGDETVPEAMEKSPKINDCLENAEKAEDFEKFPDPRVLKVEGIPKYSRGIKSCKRKLEDPTFTGSSLLNDSSDGIPPPKRNTLPLNSKSELISSDDPEESDDGGAPRKRSKRIRAKLREKARKTSVEISGEKSRERTISCSSSKNSSSGDEFGTPLRRSTRRKCPIRRFVSPDLPLRLGKKRTNSQIYCLQCNLSIDKRGAHYGLVRDKGDNVFCPECSGKYGDKHLTEFAVI